MNFGKIFLVNTCGKMNLDNQLYKGSKNVLLLFTLLFVLPICQITDNCPAKDI